MKKVLTCVGGIALSCTFAATVFAGAIDNRTNWGAEYLRTLTRNAATDYADIAAYNPAGTVKLHEGFTINGSLQYLGKETVNNVTDPYGKNKFKSDEPSYVPSVFGVYNRGNWSLFGAMTVVAGAGKVDFSKGDFTTRMIQLGILQGLPDTAHLTAELYSVGYTFGSAFKINDMFSLSMGLRYVDAYKEAKGAAAVFFPGPTPVSAPIAFEQEGGGWGGIFGINIAPNDSFNIGMRYETKTDINLDTKVKKDPQGILPYLGIYDDTYQPRDLPALLGLGVSYWVSPKLRTEVNLTYYFNEGADWDGAEKDIDDGYEVGISLEYHFTDSFLASIGYLRNEAGSDPDYMLPENPALDSNTLGGGIAYAITESLHTNLSTAYVFYKDDSFTSPIGPVKYEKSVLFLAAGMEYRF